MNKKNIAIISFLLLALAMVFYMMRPIELGKVENVVGIEVPEPQKEDIKQIVIEKNSPEQKDAIIRVEQKSNLSAEEKKAELKKIMLELSKFDDKCVESDKKQFPDDRLIDINDPFYSKPEMVIQKMHDGVWENMNRPISREARELMKDIINQDPQADTAELYAQLNAIEICRPARTMTYVETVYEAYKSHKWNDKIRQEILFVTYSMFEFVIKKEFSTPNLLLMLSMMRTMSENGVIAKESLDDINRLFTRVVDQEKYFRDTLRDGKSSEEKVSTFREDFQIKDELGQEVINLMREYRRRYAPDFAE